MKIEIKRCFKSEDLLNKEFTNEYGTNEVCIRKCGIPLYEVTLIHNDKKTGKEKKMKKFIEDNNIDVCFAINQDEMLDCLKEHGKLKHEIEVLKFKEKNYLKQIKHLKQEQASNHEHNLLVENLKSRIKQLEDVIRSMK